MSARTRIGWSDSLLVFGKKHVFSKTALFILISFLASMILMAVVYPELLVYRSRTFMYQHDTGIPFENIFTLISHYYNGGIQLWDRFDQMNYAFSHTSSGLYALVNLMVAGCYVLFAPLFNYPGEVFHAFHSIGFYGAATLLRTIGGYLLLRRFVRSRLVIFVSLLYLNTFLSAPLYNGLDTNNIYSLLPLLLYFILAFFERFKLGDFLAGLIVLTICVANCPLFGLGYFYQVVHFFIISCILVTLIYYLKQRSAKVSFSLKKAVTSKKISRIVIVLILCLLMMLPYLIMARSVKTDFHLPSSGWGDTEGRMQYGFSAVKYFKAGASYTSPKDFFLRSLDFWNNNWANSWPFLGGFTLILTCMGLIFSKNRYKHIFLLTILLVFLANTPKRPFSFAGAAHWANALTNPFAFLLRSFHMSAMLVPFLLLPLIALGLQAFRALIVKKHEQVYIDRVPKTLFFFGCMFIISILILPYPVCNYALFVILASSLLLYISWAKGSLRVPFLGSFIMRFRTPLIVVIFLVLFATDLFGFSVYIRNDPYSANEITPRIYDALDRSTILVLDYQNPRILPFREYYRSDMTDIEPHIFTCQNSYGLFYQYTPMERYLRQPYIYHPKPVTYKDMYADKDARGYLGIDERLIFLAEYAVPVSDTDLGQILDRGLGRDVVMVDSEREDLPRLLSRLPRARGKGQAGRALPQRELKFHFPFYKSQYHNVGSNVEYSFDLPGDFPSYISTTVFTDDRNNIRLTVAGKELSSVQGKLLEPFTYDIQNVREGKLFLLLPETFDIRAKEAILELKLPADIRGIWRNEHDNLGLDYVAPNDGWLVFHFPYDEKWRLKIDDKPAEVFRVNNYFIGTPVKKGTHKVLLQYWPDTRLREMILISIILTVLAFISVVIYGVRREDSYTGGR